MNILAKQKCSFTINFNNIWTAIVLLLFIKPQISEDIAILDFIFNAGRIGLSIVYVVLMFLTIKKISRDWLYLFGIFVCVFATTNVYGGIISKAITHYVPAIGLLAFILCNKKDLCSVFKVAISLGYILLFLNLITFFAFPNGMIYREASNVRVWLLGQKQDLAGFIFPILYFSMILGRISKKYEKTFLYMYILSFVTVFLEQSVAAFICLLTLGLLCFFDNFISQKIKKPVLISICIAAFGIIQYISYNFNSMPGFQALLLKINTVGISKVRSLSTRFSMWKFAWDTFFKHPVFGMGELSRESWIRGVGFYHSILDNMFMDLLMTAGFIGILGFIILLVRSFNILNKYSKERNIRYMSYGLFVLCIYMFFGSPFFPMVFLMISTAAWLPKMITNIS